MINQEQLAFRKGRLGASDTAAALGISKWKTKAQLYCEIMGLVEPFDIGERGIIGNEIEPVIISAYTRKTGIEVFEAPGSGWKGIPKGTYIHPEYTWMICHLDGAMPDYQMTLECKNVGPRMYYDWGMDEDPEGPPLEVQAQVTQQAILADVERVDVAAFFGGNELRVYPMEITKSQKRDVLDGLKAFWEDHIVKRVQPEVTGRDLDLLKQLYPGSVEEKKIYVESTETALGFQDYRNAKDKLKKDKEMVDAMKAKIIEFMGNATVIMRGDQAEFTYKRTKDTKKTDYKAISEQMAESVNELAAGSGDRMLDMLIPAYTKTKKGHRVFNDKEPK